MERSLATRLELLKSGVKPELIRDDYEASGTTSRSASKPITPPSKHDLESYEVFKVFENRE